MIRVQIDSLTQRYRVIRERPDSLREAFTKVFRHKSSVQVFTALSDISLKIYDGEILGIIGRNGSGKSTLLKVIAGVYKPSLGMVRITGTVAALIELGAGFHYDLTGRENILLNGLLLGLSRREIAAREKAITDFAELGEFIDSPAKQYSSGMMMRLAFAISTEVDPEILLVDEILAVGDAEFYIKCDRRMQEFRNRGKTIVLVTHDLHAVRKFCKRVVLLDHGRLLAEGHPDEVLQRYEEMVQNPVA